jgi:hypothetical protein
LQLLQLYEAAGERTKAREQMITLLALEGQNPAHIAHYIGSLLRWGEIREAELWLGQLEKLEPASPRALQLRNQFVTARKTLPKPSAPQEPRLKP